LRQKQKRRIRLWTTIDQLKGQVWMAEAEDYWDELVDQRGDGSWGKEVRRGLEMYEGEIRMFDERTREMSRLMWGVVLREREMKESEERDWMRMRVEEKGKEVEGIPK
jgi:hypothetical protein